MTKTNANHATDTSDTSEAEEERFAKTAIRFPRDTLHRLKCAVLHAQRQDPSLTLVSVLSRGSELAIKELEKKYGPAPDLKATPKLRTGRRLNV